ncbi:MAG: FkbM family methyltransferase [Prolixibacteraceae bacterium]
MFDPTMFGYKTFIQRHFHSCFKRFQLKKAIKSIIFIRYWKRKLNNLREKGIFFVNEGLANRCLKNYNTFSGHLKKFDIQNKRILLKIDIEGNEYPVLKEDSFYKYLDNVNQIIVEFHDLKNRLRDVYAIIKKFNTSFDIVHIHGNNYSGTFILLGEEAENDIILPDVMEVTLAKREGIRKEDIDNSIVCYPIPGLDFPNNLKCRDYELKF